MARFNFSGRNDQDQYPSRRSFRFNTPQYEQPEEEEYDPYADVLKRYQSVLSEDAPALRRYRDASQNVPKREDYELGGWGRFGAALAGFGAGMRNPSEGIAVARSLRENPYRQAMADFEVDRNLMSEEAEFERYDRTNKLKGLDIELESLKDRDEQYRKNVDTQSQVDLRGRQGRNYDSQVADREYNRNNPRYHFQDTGDGLMMLPERGDSEPKFLDVSTLGGKNLNLNRDRFVFDKEMGRGNLDARNRGLDDDRRHDREMERLGMFGVANNAFSNNLRANRPSTQSYINPSQRKSAQDQVMDELYRTRPDLRDFIDWDKNEGLAKGYAIDIPPERIEEFINFRRAVEGRVEQLLNSPRGSSDSNRRFNFRFEQ